MMEELELGSFLSRRAKESHGLSPQLRSLAKGASDLSRRVAENHEARTQAIIELSGPLERTSKISVDLADLSTPTYPVA